MKKIFTLAVLVYSLIGYSQIQSKIQKIVKVVEPQTFYLNGGVRNMMGGKSRTGIKIDLPPNTVEWYYVFTTEPNKNSQQNIQLEKQLILLLKTVGYSADFLRFIKVPVGQGLIDVFLTDRKGYDTFFEKDAFGGWVYNAPSHSIEGSGKNMREGKVKIDDIKNGSHFLVVRNTSSTTGINIKLEVVAVVEETVVDMSKWDKKNKDMLFNILKKEMKESYPYYAEDKIEEISSCVMTKMISQVKPADVNELAEYELKMIFKKYCTECINN